MQFIVVKVMGEWMRREDKLLKNTVILGLGTFLPKFASFIILPILTGYLTRVEYGTYDLITILVSFFLPAVTLQIQTAAFRFLIDVREDINQKKNIITNVFAYTIPISLIALGVLFFLLKNLSMEEKSAICIYFVADILANTERQIARGLSKNKYYSISAILGSLGQLMFVLIFVFILNGGLFGATLALSFSALCETFYLFFSMHLYKYIDFHIISIDQIKRLLAYSWPMVPNSMSMWVMRVSDRLVITIFMGASANAIYAVANKIPSILTIAQNTFNMAWQENATIVSVDKDAEEYYSKMFRILYDFMAGAFCILVSLTPVFFKILIKGNYDEAYRQIPILFLAMFFFSIAGYIGGIYVAYKKTTSVGITTIVAAVCNLIINLLCIKKIGLYAASGSTLISYIFLCIYRMIDVKKIVNINYEIKHLISVFIVLIAVSLFCMFEISALNVANFIIAVVFFATLNGRATVNVTRKLFTKIVK